MGKPILPKSLDADGHRWETVTKTLVPATFLIRAEGDEQRPTPMGIARRHYKTLWCVRCGCLQFTEQDRGFNGARLGDTRREYRAVGSDDTMLTRPKCVQP